MPAQIFTTGQIPTANDFNSLTQNANANITGGTINGVAVSSITAGGAPYNSAAVAITGGVIALVSSALISGASIAVNAALSNNFKVTLTANGVLANPTSMNDGMVLNFRFKQDATGSRTLTYGTAYKFSGGTPPVLSTAANAVDLMSCYYDATDNVLACSLSKGFA